MSTPTTLMRRDISDSVDCGLIMVDADLRVQLWNQWIVQRSGLPADRVLGQPLSVAFNGIDARLEHSIMQVILRGVPMRTSPALQPAPLPLFDSQQVPDRITQAITLTPIARLSSERWDCLIQITDITSTVKREALLRDQAQRLEQAFRNIADAQAAVSRGEQRFAQLAEQAPVGIFEINGDGHCVFVNQRFCQMTNLRSDEVLNTGFARVIHPDDRDAVMARWTQSASDEQAFSRELRLQHHNGQWIWVRIDSTPLRLEDGQVWHIGTCVDITESKQRSLQYEFRANHDALTGLLNRERFEARLRVTVAGTLAVGGHAALLYIDLDRFKPINDSHGHAAGDAALKTIAQRIQAVLRTEDQPARLGGDEFAILISDVTTRDIPSIVADKVRSALRQPIWFAGELLHLDCSIGIALCPDDAQDADALLALADSRMYEQKRNHHEGETGRVSIV